jgi:hypothetical protein
VKKQTVRKNYVFTDATVERLAALTEQLEMSETKVIERLVKEAAIKAGIEKNASKAPVRYL